MIWYCDSEDITLAPLFDPFQTQYNALAGYVRVGGNLVLCGATSAHAAPVRRAVSDHGRARRTRLRPWGSCGTSCTSDTPTTAAAPSTRTRRGTTDTASTGPHPATGWESEFSSVYIDSVGPLGYPGPRQVAGLHVADRREPRLLARRTPARREAAAVPGHGRRSFLEMDA